MLENSKNKYFIPAIVVVIFAIIAVAIFLSKRAGSKDKQVGQEELVWWKYDRGLEEAQKLQGWTMIHFYSVDCYWCHKMEDETYQDPEVKRILKEYFVIIKVNVNGTGKVMLEGKLTTESMVARRYEVMYLPTIGFLEPDGIFIDAIVGYKSAEDFLPILEYVTTSAYKKMKLPEFMKLK
jgi:thioredoxin-related protein